MNSSISVVIPLYNKEPYIGRAVASVLNQTVLPGEVIIVDDGSTDNGVRVVKSVGSGIVRIISQPNQGPSAARNTGISNAKGDWVALLDADDIWLPNHLEEITKLIDGFPYAALVSTRYKRVAISDTLRVDTDVAEQPLRQIDYFVEAARDQGIVSSSTCALRCSVARELRGFSSYRYGEDVAFWARVAMDYKVAISHRITAIYCRNTGGATDTTRAENDGPLTSISEVCPVLEVLEMERDARSWERYPRNIRKFVDSWLLVHLKQSIYMRNLSRATSIARLMVWQFDPGLLFWRSIATFPNVLIAIVRIRDAVRKRV